MEENKIYFTFDDLEFQEHPMINDFKKAIESPPEEEKGYETNMLSDLINHPHTQAILNFGNGYGVSVIFGTSFYSNGRDTYEVGILFDGELTSNNPFEEQVIGWQTKDEVTKIMRKLQESQ